MAACREQTGISCAVVFRLHGEVEVVGHQTNREHGHGDLDAGVGNGLEEGKIIAGLVKDVPQEKPIEDEIRRDDGSMVKRRVVAGKQNRIDGEAICQYN